jgi:Helicase HerA, central domain
VRRRGQVDAPLVIEALPHEVPFGVVGRLLPSAEPVELRVQLHRIPRTQALDLLRRAGAVAESELAAPSSGGAAPAELASESDSASELGRRVADREQDLFRVGLAFHARGPGPRRAERVRAGLVRRAQALGFRLRRPVYEAARASAPPALDGSEPRPSGYWHTLHTDGAAAFFPFVDEVVVEAGGVLVGLLLDDAAPVILDRYQHASHSWAVFGATGSGKSFFAALTALRTRWGRPDLDLVFVDPLGEFGGLARRLGGSVVSLARDGVARLNPLDPATTGYDLEEKAARAGAFLRALFPSLRDEEAAVLDAALERRLRAGGEPTFSDLAREVAAVGGAGRLPALLEVFRSGSLRHLDGPTTASWGDGPLSIDLSSAADGQLAFHLAYVLDAVYGRLRSRPGPKLVIVDEAHLLARDAATAAFLDRLVRHVRHFGAGLLLVSQNPDDFLATESGRSLLRNLRATLLLRLPEVSPAAREFLGLTAAEADWLPRARLPREAGYAEGLLRHGPAHLPLALVASTPEYELLSATLGRPAAGPP